MIEIRRNARDYNEGENTTDVVATANVTNVRLARRLTRRLDRIRIVISVEWRLLVRLTMMLPVRALRL